MNTLVTILTVNHPHELSVIKGRLESEGIECVVIDGLTVQVYGFISQAIGGVKLQVHIQDVERANGILVETGHIKEPRGKIGPQFYRFDKFTSNIPFINRLRVELRIIIIGILVIVATLYLFLLIATPI